jgi:predicted transcriptional regulator
LQNCGQVIHLVRAANQPFAQGSIAKRMGRQKSEAERVLRPRISHCGVHERADSSIGIAEVDAGG